MYFKKRRGRRRRVAFKIKKDTIFSAISILCLVGAIVSLLSFFAEGTVVRQTAQPFLSRFFGWGTFFIPIILGLAGLILSRAFSHKIIQPRVLLGIFGLMVCSLAIFNLFIPNQQAALAGDGGGVFGLYIHSYLKGIVGGLGSIIILFLGALVFFLVTFNLSFKQIAVFFSKKVFPVLKKIWALFYGFFGKFFRKKEGDGEGVLESAQSSLTENDFSQLNTGENKETSEDGIKMEILPPYFCPVTKDQFSPNTASTSVSPDVTVEENSNISGTEKPKRKPQVWQYPSVDLLSDTPSGQADRGDIKQNAATIEATLSSFGIKVRVVEVNSGPSVTQYALQAAEGTKIAKIMNLQNDVALALASPTGSVRIEAPIPGRSLIGVEVPNYKSSIVDLKGILSSSLAKKDKSPLLFGLGLDVAGNPITSDLAKMPHVLVAGQTGSGKSIMLHVLLMSLLFRRSPEEVRLILVDPKRVEMPLYSGIPHLFTPVVTEPEKALGSFKWAVTEMERRYKIFEKAKVRDLAGYNEQSGFQALPYIVIVVDELADLMAVAPVEVEKNICRLAQMSRATGIHLVLATQRPSVNVLTGLIKANIPCRISFSVASLIDSRVIIDQPGAEKLLGKGDMLYVPPTSSKPLRVQGAYVSPTDIKKLTQFLKDQDYEPLAESALVMELPVPDIDSFNHPVKNINGQSLDDLFSEAVGVVAREKRASASLLQRRLSIGYSRAARLIDEMEMMGVISSGSGNKPRDVLIDDPDTFFKRLGNS